jgi:threonine dehydrogenase-like Zn-dependent dehydrogenase
MLALQYRKSVPRYIWVRLLGGRFPRMLTAPGAFLRLTRLPDPRLPTPNWVRVRPILGGICGSDVAALSGKSSIYLSAFTSFPFVPGHEIVGRVVETGDAASRFSIGDRVVLEPALGCVVRGVGEICGPCTSGHYANCERVMEGDISSGIQTGYCRDTGGGWGTSFVAHESQLYAVPDGISDEAAVLAEPLSCAVHGVLQADVRDGANVLVVGGGTIALLTVAVLKMLVPGATVTVTARYEHQRELARSLGADNVIEAGRSLSDALTELSGATVVPLPIGKPAIVGGFDVTFECTGSGGGMEDAVRWTRAQGRLVLSGMPDPNKLDLTPVWYQELRVTGSYAYSTETRDGARVNTFDIALDMLAEDGWSDRIGALVRHRFPLKHHRQAIATAMRPGRHGAVKTVFDLADAA